MATMMKRLNLAFLGAVAAWSDCSFPDVGYFAMDEAPGVSYSYAIAAMNGNMCALAHRRFSPTLTIATLNEPYPVYPRHGALSRPPGTLVATPRGILRLWE